MLYTLHSTLYTLHSTLYILYCILLTVLYRTLYCTPVICTLYSVLCTLYSTHETERDRSMIYTLELHYVSVLLFFLADPTMSMFFRFKIDHLFRSASPLRAPPPWNRLLLSSQSESLAPSACTISSRAWWRRAET